jgi:uncharacterized membrane protein
MQESLSNLGISHPLVVFILSMIPIAELRGAIPVGIVLYNIQWFYVLPIALIGNLLPVPLLFLLLKQIRKLSNKMGIVGVWVEKFLKRTQRRADSINRYGKIGLTLFVAVPLPVTGAWTGAIAAYLLGFKFRDAFLPIAAGVLIAGIIVTAISVLSNQEELNWVYVGIACAILIAVGVILLWLRKRQLNKQSKQVNKDQLSNLPPQ